MKHTRLILALLTVGVSAAAGPSYTAAGLVNASSFTGGPFAPGSVVTIFGSRLARSAQSAAYGPTVPLELNYVRVYVQDQPVPLLYVSPEQINFIMSSVQNPGEVKVRVVTEGLTGPEVTVPLVASAPSLFTRGSGYAIAQDAAGVELTADHKARPNDWVVIYLTGLGRTSPNPNPGEVPFYAGQAVNQVKVTLGGVPIDNLHLKYVGLTPGWAGLYQINLVVPDGVGTDPEIRIEGDVTAAGLKIPIR